MGYPGVARGRCELGCELGREPAFLGLSFFFFFFFSLQVLFYQWFRQKNKLKPRGQHVLYKPCTRPERERLWLPRDLTFF